MDSDQRRQELASRGFVVMRQPFRSGSVYCMRHAEHQKGGQLYSIDLANGRWHRWGIDRDGVWHEWDDLPCVPKNKKEAHEPLHMSPRDACPQTFVSECGSAGFVLEPEDTTDRFGNRFARFDGVRYLICEKARLIVDRRFDKHTLDEFLTKPVEAVQPQPLRSFVSMRDQPLLASGCSHQPSLF